MKEVKPTMAPSAAEAWYRRTYTDHYYPPIRELKVQRDDLKDQKTVRSNMTRLIRQGAYASIILSLGIAACIFVASLAAYIKKVTIKDIGCFIGFIAICYLCRMFTIHQKNIPSDFWGSKMDEEQLSKKTASGRIMIFLLFIGFTGLVVLAFYGAKFK
jgi:hypothetical protein